MVSLPFKYSLELPRTMPQLLQEITHLSTINGEQGEIIAKQRQIIDNLLSIEGSILNMKQNNKNKQNIFDELHKEIADLKETNTKLHNMEKTFTGFFASAKG